MVRAEEAVRVAAASEVAVNAVRRGWNLGMAVDEPADPRAGEARVRTPLMILQDMELSVGESRVLMGHRSGLPFSFNPCPTTLQVEIE